MNYIEELFARQGALLRAVSRTGSRRRAEESREGEKSPSPAAEVWELAEETAQADAAATLGFGMDYLTVMLWGLLPFGVTQVYASTLREVGETRLPMLASVAAKV